MKSNKIVIFLSCIILILAFGCKEENMQIDYFPDFVGYNWSYNVFDSVLNKSESLKVSIVGNKTINGRNSTVWLMTYTNQTDTFFVSQSKDSVIFNSNNSVKRIFIIPFSVNQTWDESYFTSSNSKVINIENVSVAAGSRSYNYSMYEKIYFKPKIGIVKLYSKEYNLGPVQTKTWELKSFELKSFFPL